MWMVEAKPCPLSTGETGEFRLPGGVCRTAIAEPYGKGHPERRTGHMLKRHTTTASRAPSIIAAGSTAADRNRHDRDHHDPRTASRRHHAPRPQKHVRLGPFVSGVMAAPD
jgi:hypothetical protein